MKLNWGTGILIFIILFLLLCGVFITFSFKHNNDLVTDDYYEQGAGYSKQIEINKRSAIFNDSINIVENGSNIETYVCKTIVEATDSLDIYFFRPSDKKQDFRTVVPINAVIQLAKANFAKGRFIVKFSWKQKNDSYLIEKDFFVK